MADTPPAPTKARRKSAPRKTTAKAATSRTAPAKAAAATAPARRTRKAALARTATASPMAERKEKAVAALKTTREKLHVQSEKWREQAETLKEQATRTARKAAVTGKEKTGSAMHSLSKLINDTAGTVDDKLGSQYGDYARYAAEAIAGAAATIDSKDIDELIGDAREFVRKSPAVAIGAAAIAGFVLMRLAKSARTPAAAERETEEA